MKTTAIYVRVSTDRQAQAQTIQQQLERLPAHLAREGQTLTEDNIFRDDGYSGASLNRPGLDQLRDRVSRACFERVLMTSPDRLARRFVHQMLIMEEWERAGCEVQFLDRPMSQVRMINSCYKFGELWPRDLSDLILRLEESPWSGASEARQTPEKRGDLSGRGGSSGNLFAPQERVLTNPALTGVFTPLPSGTARFALQQCGRYPIRP
jgi:Resolvase, N terminal domain